MSAQRRRREEPTRTSEAHTDVDGSQSGSPAVRTTARRLRSSDVQLTVLPPTIVPMTEEQQRRAVSALAELLRWAVEEKDREEPRAA